MMPSHPPERGIREGLDWDIGIAYARDPLVREPCAQSAMAARNASWTAPSM